MSVKMRQEVERRIVRRLVRDLLKAGKRISVSLERGYDLDEMLVGSTNRRAIMCAAFAGDECHLFIHDAEGPTSEDGVVLSEGWVHLVFGNDGWDVISNYTTCLESFLEGANAVSLQYQ